VSRLVLDTSAYSHFQLGHAEAVARIDGASWVGVPSITVGELETGFRLGRRYDANHDLLERFLANPVVELIRVDGDVAQIYAEIVVALRRAGRPLPTNDIWIAACAASVGATVLTFDAHFAEIDRVGALVLDGR
jgi:predicted nucleic acid-binding protein